MANDGGPAFPRASSTPYSDVAQDGMTLRDWFAGQALSGIMVCLGVESKLLTMQAKSPDEPIEGVLARWAYEIADATLREREKG